jgi:hypothetical protein
MEIAALTSPVVKQYSARWIEGTVAQGLFGLEPPVGCMFLPPSTERLSNVRRRSYHCSTVH